MKKIMLVLSILIVILSGCGQIRKDETENSIQVVDTVTSIYDIIPVEEPDRGVNPLFDIQEIDSVSFFTLKENTLSQRVELEKLTDLEQAKRILNGRVIWSRCDDETYELIEDEEGDFIKQVLFTNGKTISYEHPEIGFIAYFPEEDILFLEGGHCSSILFNLTTGEETDEVGDPDYWRYSPSKRLRFNGYYNGQTSVYFLQENRDEKYETIIDLDYSYDSDIANCIGFVPEYLPDVFWQNDSTLIFTVSRYYYPEDITENFYYQLVLR